MKSPVERKGEDFKSENPEKVQIVSGFVAIRRLHPFRNFIFFPQQKCFFGISVEIFRE